MTDDTTTNAIATVEDDAERRRKAAILRAVGLESVPAEQRELALAIANRYDLDLMLKHLVLIEGRPYITRDALLWVAHRSGHFDGIVTTEPTIKEYPGLGECWWSEATVWRDDMSHPFTYGGRYPVGGQNKKYGPEMAIKVAECMTLRRAFNVSAATVEERWAEAAEDAAMNATPAAPPQSLSQLVENKAAAIAERQIGAVPPPAVNQDEDGAVSLEVGGFATGVKGPAPMSEEASEFTKAMTEAGAPKPPKSTRTPVSRIPTDTSAMVKGAEAAEEATGTFKSTRNDPELKTTTVACDSPSPYVTIDEVTGEIPEAVTCGLIKGHTGVHRNANESWD